MIFHACVEVRLGEGCNRHVECGVGGGVDETREGSFASHGVPVMPPALVFCSFLFL